MDSLPFSERKTLEDTRQTGRKRGKRKEEGRRGREGEGERDRHSYGLISPKFPGTPQFNSPWQRIGVQLSLAAAPAEFLSAPRRGTTFCLVKGHV